MTLLATIVVLALLGAMVAAVFYVSQSPRCRQIKQFCQENRFEFQRLVALDKDVRTATFNLFTQGEIKHAENQIFGSWQGRTFKCLDYSVLTKHGPVAQSALIVSCELSQAGSLCITRQPQNHRDAFTEANTASTDARQSLHDTLLPSEINGYKMEAGSPVALQAMLGTELKNWLEQHPGAVIEHSNHLLLIYRESYLLSPTSILQALEAAVRLAELLEGSGPKS